MNENIKPLAGGAVQFVIQTDAIDIEEVEEVQEEEMEELSVWEKFLNLFQ